MSAWLRRTSGILSLGGGSVGVALILTQLLANYPGFTALLFSIAFLGVYSWGIAAGVLLLEGARIGLRMSLAYWFIQILQFSTPWLLFELSSGARVVILYGQGKLNFNAIVGSHFNFFFGTSGPWVVGINVLALVMFVLLVKAARSIRQQNSVDPVVKQHQSSP